MINVLLAGVGGQGTVLAAKVLAQAAQAKGWQVRTAETIGMAQRGGDVTSHVRMGSDGEEVFSSLITPGRADMIIALEPGEAARALPYLAPGGVLVTATTAIQPVTSALSSEPYRAGDVVAALEQSLQIQASLEQTVAADRDAVDEAAMGPDGEAPCCVMDPATGEWVCGPEAAAILGRGNRGLGLDKDNLAGADGAEADGAEAEGVAAGEADESARDDAVMDYPVPLFVPVDDERLVHLAGEGSRKSLNMMLLAVAIAQNRIPLTLDEVKEAVAVCVKPQFVAMNLAAIDKAAEIYG